MKKVIVAIVLATLLLAFAVPAYADDPPDTQVNVGVVTPGNVDLNVGINADGSVSVTVDGFDMSQAATRAQVENAIRVATNKNGNGIFDYIYYWKITGIGNMVEGRLTDLEKVGALLLSAQAKLIQGYELTNDDIATINTAVESARATIEEINATLGELKAQDDKTWNQLMNGAEYHISILDTQLTAQQQMVDSLQVQVNSLQATLDATNNNYNVLWNYTDYLKRQYLYYFWAMGGAIAIIAVIALVAIFKRHSRI